MARLLLVSIFLHTLFISNGQQFNWAASMGSSSNPVSPGERGESVRVDASGNVITVGMFVGTADFNPGPAVFNLIASPDVTDIFIQKLDASGNFLWAKGMNGIGSAGAYSMDLDASGNIIVTGYFWGVKDFDPGPSTVNLSSAGMADMF